MKLLTVFFMFTVMASAEAIIRVKQGGIWSDCSQCTSCINTDHNGSFVVVGGGKVAGVDDCHTRLEGNGPVEREIMRTVRQSCRPTRPLPR